MGTEQHRRGRSGPLPPQPQLELGLLSPRCPNLCIVLGHYHLSSPSATPALVGTSTHFSQVYHTAVGVLCVSCNSEISTHADKQANKRYEVLLILLSTGSEGVCLPCLSLLYVCVLTESV